MPGEQVAVHVVDGDAFAVIRDLLKNGIDVLVVQAQDPGRDAPVVVCLLERRVPAVRDRAIQLLDALLNRIQVDRLVHEGAKKTVHYRRVFNLPRRPGQVEVVLARRATGEQRPFLWRLPTKQPLIRPRLRHPRLQAAAPGGVPRRLRLNGGRFHAGHRLLPWVGAEGRDRGALLGLAALPAEQVGTGRRRLRRSAGIAGIVQHERVLVVRRCPLKVASLKRTESLRGGSVAPDALERILDALPQPSEMPDDGTRLLVLQELAVVEPIGQ